MEKEEIYDLWFDRLYRKELSREEHVQLVQMLLTDERMMEWFRVGIDVMGWLRMN